MIALVLMTDEEVANFGRSSDAGFGCLRTARGLLPLAAMDVDARVAGVIANIEVAQTFVNTTGMPIEATYIFPLPDRAAMNRFRMEVAGRVIEGVVDERGAAREQYEHAIQRGHRAAITEEERAGVFTLRVGNLMPGEAATVRLSLVGPLPVDDGEVTLRFPLVVAPRYIPGSGLGGEQAGLGIAADTNLVPDASRISPPVLLPGCPNPVRLGIRVALADHHVRDVASSLHAVTSGKQDAYVVEVQPGERLDRDFILRWRIDGSELRSALVCQDDADGKGGSFMLTFVPPSSLAVSQKPRDVVFVIDRSGSMHGWKMQAARRATSRMIDTLTSRDRFHVITFDNAVEVLPDVRLTYATDRTRYRAVEELGKIEARGGTELALPLQLAVKTLAGGHDDRERVIVLVTDGQVGNEDHILREIAPNLRNVRVFTLGIDQAVNAAFLRRLAGAGGGLCELVESEDRLDEVMAKVHRRIGTPVATELRIDAAGLDVVWASVAPSRLPDVYAGAPVTILGRYRGSASHDAAIGIDGTSYGEPLKLRVARESVGAAAWLGPSWARAYIRDLEDKYAAGSRQLDTEIIRVSKQWSVLSRFTAFVAVDRSEVANPGGHLIQAVQPVESPAGWEDGAPAGHTSTRAELIGGRPGGMMPPSMGPMATPLGGPPPVARSMAMPQSAAFEDEDASEVDSLGGSFAQQRSISPPRRPSPPPGPAARSAPPPAPEYARPRPTEASATPPSMPSSSPLPPKQAAPKKREEAAAQDASAYLAKLSLLARDLLAQARGTISLGALRLLRQRLVEWVEDLRSVGGFDALADAVEDQVHRLATALASNTDLANEVLAIGTELAHVAAGGPLPPPRRGGGRVAFWK